MLAELAAANAAFAVIKQCVSNGRELANVGKSISDFVFAKEQIQKKASKQKAKGGGGDLEEFMALEKINEQEKQLQAEVRKSRRYAEKMAEKQREEYIQIMGYLLAAVFFIGGVGFIIYFAAKWAGKI